MGRKTATETETEIKTEKKECEGGGRDINRYKRDKDGDIFKKMRNREGGDKNKDKRNEHEGEKEREADRQKDRDSQGEREYLHAPTKRQTNETSRKGEKGIEQRC